MDITPSDIKKITDSSYDYEIEYLDKENNETTRRISPIRSFEYRDNDYLEAYCHLRKENRNFLCSSIVSFEILKTKKRKVFSPKHDEKKWGKTSSPKPVPKKDSGFTADLVTLAIKTIVAIPFALLGTALGASRGMGKSTAVFGESKHDWYHSQSGKKDKLYKIDA